MTLFFSAFIVVCIIRNSKLFQIDQSTFEGGQKTNTDKNEVTIDIMSLLLGSGPDPVCVVSGQIFAGFYQSRGSSCHVKASKSFL